MKFQVDVQEMSGVVMAINVVDSVFDDLGNEIGKRPESEVLSERKRLLQQGQFMAILTDITNGKRRTLKSPFFWKHKPADRNRRLFGLMIEVGKCMAEQIQNP